MLGKYNCHKKKTMHIVNIHDVYENWIVTLWGGGGGALLKIVTPIKKHFLLHNNLLNILILFLHKLF